MFNVKQFGIASTLALALCGTANATSVTYDYLGKDFNVFRVINQTTNGEEITIDTLPTHVGPRISGSATFADGVDNPVTSYFLTDGTKTIDNIFSGINPFGDGQSVFSMTFNNNNVESWNVGLSYRAGFFGQENKNIELFTNSLDFGTGIDFSGHQENAGLGNDLFFRDRASILSNGTWTLREEPISAVPVPAALPLMASALGLFGFIKRRKQSV